MARESAIQFRRGTTALMQFAHVNKVPLIVLSAGIKEVIDQSISELET